MHKRVLIMQTCSFLFMMAAFAANPSTTLSFDHVSLGILFSLGEGAFLGLFIAAPIGPISLLCLQRTLAKGRESGLATGLGIAGADFVYASVASFGLTSITKALTGGAVWLRLAGGIYLIWLGLKIFRALPPKDKNTLIKPATLASDTASAFFLTLSNPMTIISFSSMFVANDNVAAADLNNAAFQALGVFLGSGVWWIIWSVGASKFRSRIIERNAISVINKISGAAIIAGAIYVLSRAIH